MNVLLIILTMISCGIGFSIAYVISYFLFVAIENLFMILIRLKYKPNDAFTSGLICACIGSLCACIIAKIFNSLNKLDATEIIITGLFLPIIGEVFYVVYRLKRRKKAIAKMNYLGRLNLIMRDFIQRYYRITAYQSLVKDSIHELQTLDQAQRDILLNQIHQKAKDISQWYLKYMFNGGVVGIILGIYISYKFII